MAIGPTMKVALLADAGIVALVEDRIHPMVFPAGVEMPCITYRIVSGAREPVLSEEVYTTRIQYDIWAETYLGAAAIKAVLMTLFNFFSGTVNSQKIISTKVDLNFDVYEAATKLNRAIVDVRVRHEGA